MKVKISQLERTLEVALSISQPVCVWGEPGIGKSKIIANLAKKRGVQLIDLRATLLDAVDLRGLPYVNGDKRAHWATPEFLPRAGEGILLLDEVNRAPMLVQCALLQLVLDRKLGDYTLPAGWTVLAACNDITDGGGVVKMPSALMNRFLHVECETSVEDWVKWAKTAGINHNVIAFLRFRPELLQKFDKNAKAWPSGRSWEFLSRIVDLEAHDVEHTLFTGAVGEGSAVEFSAFLRLSRSLPDIDLLIEDESNKLLKKIKLTDTQTCYALASALSYKATVKNFDRVIEILDELSAEYGVLAIKDSVERLPDLRTTKAFPKWVGRNKDVLGL